MTCNNHISDFLFYCYYKTTFSSVQMFDMVLRKRHVFNYLYTDSIHMHGSFVFWCVCGLIDPEFVICCLLKLKCVNNYQVNGFVHPQKGRENYGLLWFNHILLIIQRSVIFLIVSVSIYGNIKYELLWGIMFCCGGSLRKIFGMWFFISLELRCKHASCWIISMIGYEQITMRKNGWNVGLL